MASTMSKESFLLMRLWSWHQNITLRTCLNTLTANYRRKLVFQNYRSNLKNSVYLPLPVSNCQLARLKCYHSFPCQESVISKEQFNTIVIKRNFASSNSGSSAKVRVTSERRKALGTIKSSVKHPDGVTNILILDTKDWLIVYRFGYIKVARVIQRLKIYQTGFTCCLVLPASVGLFISGNLHIENLLFVLGSSSFACIMLYVMGTMCSRLIGAIYASKTDPTLIRIGHMNFWGKREDQIFNRNEIVPFSEIPDNVSDIYVNVKFYSDPDTKLHLSVRYGTVYNKIEFEEIFGKVDGLKITAIPPYNRSK